MGMPKALSLLTIACWLSQQQKKHFLLERTTYKLQLCRT